MRSNRYFGGSSQRQPSVHNTWRSSSLLSGIFGPGDYGDSMDDAKDVGSLNRSKNYKYTGDVGGDDLDFFKIKLDEKNAFSAKLETGKNNNEPIALSVLNKNGKVVRRNGKLLFANVDEDDSQTLSVDGLGKGTYYLRVQSAKGDNENYKLNFSLSSSLDSGDSNSSDGRDLGELTPGKSYNFTGQVGGSDVDLYNFDLDKTSRISTFLSNTASSTSGSSSNRSIAFSILDSQKRTIQTTSGRFLFDNVEPGESATLFAPTLASGSYYVRVQSDVGNDLDYKLRLTRSANSVQPL